MKVCLQVSRVWLNFKSDEVKSHWQSISGKGWALLLCVGLGANLSRGGTFIVTSTADAGPGSLRQAIVDADAGPGSSTISFQISGSAPFTITPLSILPSVVFPTLIDGTTQPGYAGAPVIELNGSSAGASVPGLQLASGSIVRGLVINRFSAQGIVLNGSSNTIQGCYIGTDVTGTVARTNLDFGIWIKGQGNRVGGTNALMRNVVSGNAKSGIYLNVVINTSAATNNWIQGNYLGLDVSGSLAISNAFDGITVDGVSGNTISGNVISGNGLAGVYLKDAGASGNMVWGNFIGTDATGKTALGNKNAGVEIKTGSGNQLGATNAGAGNVISGNKGDGIYLFGGATGNFIQGNYLGLSAAGTNAIPNALNGISMFGAVSNLIGGAVSAARNVISGNATNGIGILLTNDSANSVWGNYIGTDANGAKAIPNALAGVRIQGCSNFIGGTLAGSGNVISGNGQQGVYLVGANGNVTGNLLQGNIIGLDATGASRLGNGDAGIGISSSANNQIGGASTSARNVLSANVKEGVFLIGSSSTNNQIQGNYIGTDATGTTGMGNGFEGITVQDASFTQIGGTATGAGNLISDNNNRGILLANASKNVLQGNFIGTKADGSAALGNLQHGIDVDVGSTNNVIGGTAAGAGNRIAFAKTFNGSGFAGVRVRTGAYNNLISGNAIFSNDALGIDLGTAGVTANDDCDGDTGANFQQNFPTLSNAYSGTITRIRGTMNSTSGKTYQLQFFASPSGDATGYGEGQVYLDQTNLTLGATCSSNFTAYLSANVPAGWVVSATATDSANNTSEFSAVVPVIPVPLLQTAFTNPAAGQLALFWITNSGNNFILQQTFNLAPPLWTTVVGSPAVTNGFYLMAVPTTNATCFYRLNTL